MAEAPIVKPFEQPPSRIPVPISRRQSLNLDPSILQQSTSLSANGSDGRPASAQSVHKMPAGRPPASRRQSALVNASRKSSFSGQSRDPGDQAELREAFRRSSEIYTSEVTIASPTIPSAGDGEAWAAVSTRLANLPEDEAVSPGIEGEVVSPLLMGVEGGETRIPRRPSSAQSNDSGPSRGIPHSSSSYDLRGRAVTPGRDTNGATSNGKYGTSRIPQSTVMNAVSLHPTPSASSPISPGMYISASPTPSDPALRSPFLGVESPGLYAGGPLGLGLPSPSDGRASPLRRSTGSAASTKVIDGLQTEVQHLRVVLEKTRQDLRSSQRVVGSLTRSSEDLKDTKDRLRGEIDALNNALKRRERLLRETVERARSAEAELHDVKSTRKALEQSTKKQVQSMTAQVTEATFAQTKSDKECAALKDSVRSLREAWAREMKAVREEWKRGVEREAKEREDARLKHMALAKLVQSQSADRQAIQTLAADVLKKSSEAAAAHEEELAAMRAQVDRNGAETRAAQEVAQTLATELLHLRRLMRAAPREDLVQAANGLGPDLDASAIASS